jgi:hypothetical protein
MRFDTTGAQALQDAGVTITQAMCRSKNHRITLTRR